MGECRLNEYCSYWMVRLPHGGHGNRSNNQEGCAADVRIVAACNRQLSWSDVVEEVLRRLLSRLQRRSGRH